MDIAEANLYQLTLIVGTLGVEIMSLALHSSPPRNNLTIDGSQICSGTVNFDGVPRGFKNDNYYVSTERNSSYYL
jgi:hypothetical protein